MMPAAACSLSTTIHIIYSTARPTATINRVPPVAAVSTTGIVRRTDRYCPVAGKTIYRRYRASAAALAAGLTRHGELDLALAAGENEARVFQ